MKKKLFTLLTLLLCLCSGAWADDVIFKMTGTNGVSGTAGTDYTVDGSTISVIHGKTLDISATFTNGTAQVKNGHNDKNNLSINTSTGVINIGNSGGSFVSITMGNGTIQEGDIITIDSYSEKKIKLGKAANSTSEITIPYAIPEGSGLIGSSTLFFINKEIKSFSTITITRPSSGPSISASNVNILASATGGNIAYTINKGVEGGTVTAAEKGTSGWLTSVGTETTSPISFTATANTGAERTATVTLTYTYNTDQTVTKDVTITQAAKTYTITYNKGANGTGSIEAGTKSHGVAFTLSSEKFTRDSYVQTGWATTDGGDKAYDLGGSYTGNADLELFPVWEIALYTVTYDANGGTCAKASEKQASSGASVTLPTPTPAFAGCTFDGWYNAGVKIGDADGSYTPTSDITLYAKWTDNIEGKLFSYIDGNYGDKFKAFDGSGWVTADATGKSKTFTDATTGTQFVITNGAWDKKNNSISALAKYKAGSTAMKVVVPSGYKATVKIWYNSYGESKLLKIDGDAQTAPGGNKLNDNQTNSQIASKLVAVTVSDKSGDVVLTTSGSSDNIYIARVAVEALTHVPVTVGKNGYTTFASTYSLDLTDAKRPAGLKAYKATRDGANLTFVALNQTVPAGTGLLLLGEEKNGSYNIPVAAEGTAVSENALIGVTSPVAKQSVENETYYFVMKKAEDVNDPLKFAPITTTKEVTIPAGKAYVEVPSSAFTGAKALTIAFDDNNATAINGIEEVAPATTKTRKVVKNGRLVIETANGEYTVSGARVK